MLAVEIRVRCTTRREMHSQSWAEACASQNYSLFKPPGDKGGAADCRVPPVPPLVDCRMACGAQLPFAAQSLSGVAMLGICEIRSRCVIVGYPQDRMQDTSGFELNGGSESEPLLCRVKDENVPTRQSLTRVNAKSLQPILLVNKLRRETRLITALQIAPTLNVPHPADPIASPECKISRYTRTTEEICILHLSMENE